MKKLLAVFLAAFFTLGLAACTTDLCNDVDICSDPPSEGPESDGGIGGEDGQTGGNDAEDGNG